MSISLVRIQLPVFIEELRTSDSVNPFSHERCDLSEPVTLVQLDIARWDSVASELSDFLLDVLDPVQRTSWITNTWPLLASNTPSNSFFTSTTM